MNFKKPKAEVIQNAHSAAMIAASNQLNNLKYNYGNSAPITVIGTLEYAISDAIRAAVISLVNDTYTDQEFEEDLQLK